MTSEVHSAALRRLVASTPWLMRCLRSVRDSFDGSSNMPLRQDSPFKAAPLTQSAPSQSTSPTPTSASQSAEAVPRVAWCIGAGAVRSLVWDQAHGFRASEPTDVDVAYFDPTRVTSESALNATLSALHPELRWDIVNQAFVHEWPTPCPVGRPLTSLEDGLASWPETATAIGVYLDHTNRVGIVAPYGLDDLFELVLRRSPGVHRPKAFDERVTSKRFRERWPLLQLLGD